MANGARVLDATNICPDTEKWAIIDPTRRYNDMTNRYANQSSTITEENTFVEMNQADLLTIHLNPESLKELGIRYLFTPVDRATLLSRYGIACEYLTGQDGYGIWRLHYDF